MTDSEWVWWNKGDGIAVGPRIEGCKAIVFTVEEAQAICQAVNSRSASSASASATKGTGATPASDNAKPPTVKLVYNKTTKRIDKIRKGR